MLGSWLDLTEQNYSPSIVQVLQQEKPTPLENYKAFLAKHKDKIKADKIKFTETAIVINGIKFSRNMLQYEDIKQVAWIELWVNVYQVEGKTYFTEGAVDKLIKLWYAIPKTAQLDKAVKVLDGQYPLLCELLDYPKTGVRKSDGTMAGDKLTSQLWLQDRNPVTNNLAYMACRDKSGSRDRSKPWADARPIVLLEE